MASSTTTSYIVYNYNTLIQEGTPTANPAGQQSWSLIFFPETSILAIPNQSNKRVYIFKFTKVNIPCFGSCDTCDYNVFKEDSCLSCPGAVPVDGSGRCPCPTESGYFLEGGACKKCQGPCLTCSTSSTTCLTCPENFVPNNGVCECDTTAGFLLKGNTCLKCSQGCKTCDYIPSNCSSCYDAFVLQPDKTCLCDTTGNLKVKYLDFCSVCDPNCQTCDLVPNFCTSCSTGRALENGKCVCQAGDSLYNGNCVS